MCELRQEQSVLVARALGGGGDAPVVEQVALAVGVQADHRLRVADVDGQEHAP